MPKVPYVEIRFSSSTLTKIDQANAIIEEYQAQGFVLTLRQLYYQFVARDLIPNTKQSYKALGKTVSDARLAGLIDWDAIEDRTRNLASRSHWDDPSGVIHSAADGYGIDLWEGQDTRAEVWIEKEALAGVVERVCARYDVPYFSCRGYTSQSELRVAAERHIGYDASVVVIHLGDHDPSGIDMTRDIEERLAIFGASTRIRRIALNMDQVRRYKLPPNPAKQTDSRFAGYAAAHGQSSWELDALDPRNIEKMIEQEIREHCDANLFQARHEQQEKDRGLLKKAAVHWDRIEKVLNRKGKK